MYLSKLNIWNFRKFGQTSKDGVIYPGAHICFNNNLNLLVGENDSGKTTIIDAIKYVLYTRSYDYFSFSLDDFHLPPGCVNDNDRAETFTIECVFKGFSDIEAKNFLEWLSIDHEGYWLRVCLHATRDGRKIISECKTGVGDGTYLDPKARELLRVTYLKPLRDAESELAPKKGSRISQILDSHEAFDEKEDHDLVKIIAEANIKIKNFFSEGTAEDNPGKRLHNDIDSYLEEFSGQNETLTSRFSVADMRLKSILERLQLSVIEKVYNSSDLIVDPGLGSNNLLFIAAELLLLKKTDYTGLRLGLIEEIEAHLHPQAQLRLVEYLQNESKKSKIQLILSTHSPNLASKISLENLILCKNGSVFPMGNKFTLLRKGDYRFLERFLDSTKANMFFAKGIIFIEGDAENLLIPTIAQILGLSLSKYGISLVNVGSTAFLRYSKIYQRKIGDPLNIPVSIITDLDIRPDKYKSVDATSPTESNTDIEKVIQNKKDYYDGQIVRTFVSPKWTLEYAIALSHDFRWLLLESILCAKREQNSEIYGVTLSKSTKIKKELEVFQKEVEDNGYNDEEIAFKIYQEIMLNQKISKPITAHWFSYLLQLQMGEIKPLLETDKYFKYIVDAIKYAAGV